MHIGMTYDLRQDYLAAGYSPEETAEFDRLDTIEGIEQTLQALGHTTERIGNIRHLAARLVSGSRWDLVFNIAEGLYGVARESQVPALLDAYTIPYTFSDPLVLALTLHKDMTKHIVRTNGVPTPAFVVIDSPAAVADITLPLPLFAKPVAEGSSKGISIASTIYTPEALHHVCRALLQQYQQPVLVETFLPGREFTVGIVGTGTQARGLGVMEVLLRDTADVGVYSYANKAQYEERVHYRLADDAVAQQALDTALQAWRILGCRDAGRVDLRCAADGTPHFLEVNPLAGLHPVHSDLPILCRLAGVSYTRLLEQILASALERVTASGPTNLPWPTTMLAEVL